MGFPRAFRSYAPRYCLPDHVYGAILITGNLETVVIQGRKSGKWSFPKGHGNRGELPLDACLRELKEETGITLKSEVPDDTLRFSSGTYFIFYVEEKVELYPEDTNEVMSAMWVSLNRLPFLDCNRDLKSFCLSVQIDRRRSFQSHLFGVPTDLMI